MDRINELIDEGRYVEAIAVALGSITGSLVAVAIKAAVFWTVGKFMLGL